MRIFFLTLLMVPFSLWSQSINVDSLDNYISRLINEYDMPGMAIGVISGDSVILKKGYGLTSVENGSPVTAQTVYPIMSCTKAFTATCIGLLVDEGKINWNDKVIKYLPEFKLSDPWITQEITISDLLSHRSGLRLFDGDLLWYGSNYSSDEIIDKIQYYPIKGSFRLDFNYNNVMYIVAGKIIEKVSGLTFNEFLQKKIFDILGMYNSSSTLAALINSRDHAIPHIANKPVEPRSLDNATPAGGINSTINDMLLWLQMWLNQDKPNSPKFMSRNTFQTITNPKIITDNTGFGSYGFGWYIDLEDKQKVLFHGGGMPGYKSMVAIYPESGIGIVVLTNKISAINEGLVNMISAYIMHPELTDWSDNRKYFSYFGYPWDNPEKIDFEPNLPKDFIKYLGHYNDKVYGQALIKMIGSDAILDLQPSKKLFSGKLYFVAQNKFKIKLNDEFLPIGEINFEINKEGDVEGFKMDIPTDDFNFDNFSFKKIKTDGNNGYTQCRPKR